MPMDDRMLRAVDNTIRFMRMAAIQLRQIAGHAPDIANELRRIADELDKDADDLGAQAPTSRGSLA
jgi:hypothetical protein